LRIRKSGRAVEILTPLLLPTRELDALCGVCTLCPVRERAGEASPLREGEFVRRSDFALSSSGAPLGVSAPLDVPRESRDASDRL
jgi:hypothetical protein